MSQLTCDLQSIGQSLFSSSSDQAHQLGTKAVSPDGRVFRYVKAGAVALVPGKLQQGPAIVANHQNIAVAVAASAGATSVTVTLGATAATADQYANGFLVINDVAGEGHTYKIKSHPAASSSASLTLTLEDPIVVALTTSSEACLIANQYNGVVVAPTTPTGPDVGVAIYPVGVSEFGWIQTRGAVSCLSDGTPAAGSMLSRSNAVAGAVETGVLAQGFVGNALQAGVDTEYRAIYLQLD